MFLADAATNTIDDGKHWLGLDSAECRLMIRARVQGHLESLQQRFPDLLGDCDIRESAGSDYAFRFFVEKSVWAQVVSKLAEETDYDNFKDAVARHQGQAWDGYNLALHDVWSVMYRLQQRPGR